MSQPSNELQVNTLGALLSIV